jgi:predicted RNA-binding protein associated with RNAse of E/G family
LPPPERGPELVRIRYLRPPGREEVYTQEVVYRAPEVIVTYLARTPLARPVRVAGRVVLEDGSPVVWLTFPGAWHDIGLFHLPDGTPTGHYANILTPVQFRTPDEWETTDLFLDVWRSVAGELALLDEGELAAAERAGWIDEARARSARAEAARLLAAAAAGRWPGEDVLGWSLARAQAASRWERNRTGGHDRRTRRRPGV